MQNLDSLLLKTKYKITSDQSDMFGRIRLGSFVNLFIKSAIASSSKYGFGFDVLSKMNMTWMLGRLSAEIYKPVYWDDEIEIETWPKTVNGLLYIRDFVAKNSKDEIVSQGTTGWLAIDLAKKRIKSIDFIDDTYRMPYKSALDYMPLKIKNYDVDDFYKIKAYFYDIDLNQHVTAIRYLDWMMDTFEIDFHKNNYPVAVHINYINEIKLGEIINLGKKEINNNEYFFVAKNQTTSKEAFKAILKF
jgi:acyl-ACP thioesterase